MSSSWASNMAAAGQNHGEAVCRIKQAEDLSQPTETTHQLMPLSVEAVPNKAQPKQPTTFSDLPPEIRHMIWLAAIAPRVILIKPEERNTETDSPNKVDFSRIPGILFATRESRSIALQYYEQRFTITFSKALPPQAGEPTERLMCRIPLILSPLDKIAFSRLQVSDHGARRDGPIKFSIDAAPGAPKPQIERFLTS